MLGKNGYTVLGPGLVLTLLFTGCCTTRDFDTDQTVFWKSGPQELQVENAMDGTITVLGTPGTEVLEIPSGETGVIRYIAVILKVTDGSGESSEAVSMRREIEASAETPYLHPFGSNYAIRVELPDGKEHEYEIEPFDEWFEDPLGDAGRRVIIDGPPMEGLPANQ